MPDLCVNERIILKCIKTYLAQFRVRKCNLLNLAMITESHGKWIDSVCCDDWLYFVVLIPLFLKLHFYEHINWVGRQIQRSMATSANPMKTGIHLNDIRS